MVLAWDTNKEEYAKEIADMFERMYGVWGNNRNKGSST